MGLKRFPQQNVGNFRCAWTDPDKRQPHGQMLIVRRQMSDWSAKSIRWHLLNARLSINYSNIMSDNYCKKSGPGYLVPEANLPNYLPLWILLPEMRLTGWQTWPPTSNCNLRYGDPILGQKPWPGVSLIRSGSVTSWRERFMPSPWMNRSSSRSNSPSTWSCLKHSGRHLAFRCSRTPLSNA